MLKLLKQLIAVFCTAVTVLCTVKIVFSNKRDILSLNPLSCQAISFWDFLLFRYLNRPLDGSIMTLLNYNLQRALNIPSQ